MLGHTNIETTQIYARITSDKISNGMAQFAGKVKDNVVYIPHKYIRGNPSNWGYQAIVVAEKENKKHIIDFLNQSSRSKESIISANPFEVSMVR